VPGGGGEPPTRLPSADFESLSAVNKRLTALLFAAS